MEDILFWVFILSVVIDLGFVIYLWYKEIYDPYDGYETFIDYYLAKEDGGKRQ